VKGCRNYKEPITTVPKKENEEKQAASSVQKEDK
jgi:hypothetical protein